MSRKSIKIVEDGAICEECGKPTLHIFLYKGKFICKKCATRKMGADF